MLILEKLAGRGTPCQLRQPHVPLDYFFNQAIVLGMKDRTRNIMKGIGSILDIMPERQTVDLYRTVRRRTADEIMAEAWESVGRNTNSALGQFEREKGYQKKPI